MTDRPNFDHSVEGRRVRLVRCDDPYTNLEPGTTGTARHINNYDLGEGPESTLHVRWDNGSTLGLVEGVDQWEWLE